MSASNLSGLNGGGMVPTFQGIIASDKDFSEISTELPEERRAPSEDSKDHRANLAEHMSDEDLNVLSDGLLEKIEKDIESRSTWEKTVREGLKMFGVIDDIGYKGPFPKATRLIFPTLSIAAYQFQSRAIAELFPSKGPVKGAVVGDRTVDKEAQAKRVEDYMNYQLTIDDPGYFPDLEQALLYLCLYGSMFKKVYRDVITGKNISRYIKAEDLVVPYNTSSLEDAQRFTHIIRMAPENVRKMQIAGVYRDVPLDDPDTSEDSDPNSQIQQEYGTADNRDMNVPEDEGRNILFEIYAYIDLKGFEDKHDDSEEETGIALPYVITLDKQSKKILSIYRNWKESDTLKRRHENIVHYYYLPGLGFYGYGLVQLVGSVAKAQTGILRCLLNAGTLASLQGGFKTRDSKLTGEMFVVEPGVYKDIDATMDDLQKGIWSPKFGEPSPVLFQLLGTLTEQAERFTSTTEAMVGDAASTGPVGTTVAQIEQGSKVYSAIHKRIHFAAGQEFRMLAKLDEEYMPEEGYPYDVYGATRQIAKADFDDRVDVIPVSDPNFFSSAQRLATAQAILQLAQASPQLFDLREANKRMLMALDVREPELLLPEPEEAQRYDPVTEGALMIAGKPVKAFMDQDHQAHIQVHMNMIQTLAAQSPQGAEMLQPALIAHLREHYSMMYYSQAQQAMGIQLPGLNIFAEKGQPLSQPMPPQIENMIAQAAAQRMPPPPPTPEQQQANAEAQQAQAELQLEAQKAQQDIQLQQQKAMADAQLSDQKMQADFAQAQRKQEMDAQLARDRAKADLELRAQQAAVQAEIQRMQAEADEKRKQEEFEREQARQDAKLEMEMELAEAQAAHDAEMAEKEGEQSESSGENEEKPKKRSKKGKVSEYRSSSKEAQKAMAESLKGLADAITRMNGPKKVLRDAKGSIIGVTIDDGDNK